MNLHFSYVSDAQLCPANQKKKNPFKIGRSVLVVKATHSSVDSKEKRALILVDSFLTHTQKNPPGNHVTIIESLLNLPDSFNVLVLLENEEFNFGNRRKGILSTFSTLMMRVLFIFRYQYLS